MSAAAVVARVAHAASDVLVDALPAPPAPSAFAPAFPANPLRRPRLHSVPFGADPGEIVSKSAGTGLVSLLAPSSSQLATRLVLHLGACASRAVVLHLSVADDLSDVLLLRSSASYFLLSSTAQEAHDNALLASRLAKAVNKLVIHVFSGAADDTVEDEVTEDKITTFLSAQSPAPIAADELEADPFKAYERAAANTLTLVRRPVRPWTTYGGSTTDPSTVVFVLGRDEARLSTDGVLFISVSLLNPLPASRIAALVPASAERVIVLEQIRRWNVKWTPLYLDVVSALQATGKPVHSGVLGSTKGLTDADVQSVIANAESRPVLGSLPEASSSSATVHVPKHEISYTKILSHVFGDRLEVANDPSLVASQGSLATNPEFALGRVQSLIEQRKRLAASMEELLQASGIADDLHTLLSQWLLNQDDAAKSRKIGAQIVDALKASPVEHPAAAEVLRLQGQLPRNSRWIIGSDAWSYDLGASGLHHAIASGLDINILILDTLPYSTRHSADSSRRKHDVGLYAMNHGDVYVASVAVYSSYGQVLQAVMEADRYRGPSVVVAYLPYRSEEVPALEVLKETKLAVDAGYWPLYRWDPSKDVAGQEPFMLDSDAIKNDLRAFLDRQNHLSQLSRPKPALAAELVSGLGARVQEERRAKAKQAFSQMVASLDAPPLLILYASDGGNAEKVAKKLAQRAEVRGLSVTAGTMDSVPLESLAQEEYVVFISSTAGQGEPPQNARRFFKALNVAVAAGEQVLTNVKYSVFGMGDSHYWPRAEDAQYYNRPGKELDHKLTALGATRFADIGLGDDQDADGPMTGYKLWEPSVWKTFKVDNLEIAEAEPEPITNEHIKAASNFLRGTIAEGLVDTTTGSLSASDGQLTKFHGIYQQDDRDIRDERTAQGVEPAYSFMIRVRMPGGVCDPRQWLQMDQISDEHGCGNFKITTRQTFQFHGVIKRHLKSAIQDINRALLDTLAACGDVNRNVTCSLIPSKSKLHAQVYEFSKQVSEHLLPHTSAYHEIWLDKKLVAGDALKDFEPVYGDFYLPRKFKVSVAVPPTNDVDIFTNDLGFIAIVGDDGELQGFNVSIGGGMGVTHGNKKTYPRLGTVIGFCTPDQGKQVAEKVMIVQRDHGNRADRKNARLKYTVDRLGVDGFREETEKLLGWKLAPARAFSFDRNIDDFGWSQGEDGKHHYMMFIENGRVEDVPGREFKTGLREIAKVHKGTFRLTCNQHLMLSDIAEEDLPQIKAMLAKYKLDNLEHSGLRLSSSACVAFPTCGLAMAESERYLPILIDKVEKICEENGLRHDSIVMRMTGCPNGCARPYAAEVAFVGKAPGTYLMLLGGGYYGQRLNKIYRESVTEPEILAILRPMIKRYALERQDGEKFGDWTIRAGYIAPTVEGKLWYDRMGGEGDNRLAA
ncbi:sulfite reductase subunit beta [Schizophyllum amplum]|uniref:assimilatory sulfite reductase (NADPH) n=1 Tax=Schizophyllum amplum TaxID=97359 RepID=A0A550CK81_9AGAR|nr:sulfite reductase subunit beta [Auriculariopsis ampla]